MKKIICLAICLLLAISLMAPIVTSASEGNLLINSTDTTTLPLAKGWPYANFMFSSAMDIKSGATFECDLSINNLNTIKLLEESGKNLYFYAKAYAGSTMVKSLSLTLASNDFNADNSVHVKMEFPDEMTGITKILIQAYGNKCDAVLTVSNVTFAQPNEMTPNPKISLTPSRKIGYGKTISACVTIGNTTATGYTYQWYLNSSKIANAVDSTYTPVMSDIGGWLYCIATNGSTTLTSDSIRTVASDSVMKTTDIAMNTSAFTKSGEQILLTNTKLYGGKFDLSLLSGDGYFRVEYSGGNTVPQLILQTWKSDSDIGNNKSTVTVNATKSGTCADGRTKYAEYSYEDCVAAWGDNVFTFIKALRIKYTGDDYSDITLSRVTWLGYPTSYDELGEVIDCSISSTATTGRLTWIYTKHVGGEFDTSKLRDDGYFYVEYSGEYENAVYMTASFYSDIKSTWANISASETGKTANGFYSIFTVSDIKASFGNKFRNFDQIRLMVSDGKSVTAKSATIYYFAGSGTLVDDISIDGYNDVLEVPWEMYNETDKNGIAVIGASIQQNPMVTASALEGTPYYNAYGNWNAVLGRTDCVNYGIGGETSAHIQRRFDEVLRYNFNTIIMQCGTNDLGVSTDNSVVAATVSGNYTLMFEKAKAYIEEGKELHIYVIPVLPSTAPKNREKIETVDAAIAAVCEKYDFVTYMSELYDQFLASETDDTTYVNTDLVFDSIHPNAAGYAVIAKAINSKILLTDLSDSTLSELSYRLSDTSAKIMVKGFNTGSNGTSYNVLLPSGTAKNASISLFAVASDSRADITFANTVTLNDGVGSTTVMVKSNDGSTTNTYTVNFAISEYIYNNTDEYSQDVDLVPGTTWPYVQYNINYSETIYSGAKISFDIAMGEYSGKLYNELDFAWTNYVSKIIEYSEFENGKLHVTYTVSEDITNGIDALQIKFGNGGECSYAGIITVSNLTVTNGTNPNEIKDLENDNTIVPAEGGFTGFICIDDNYHMQIGTGVNEEIVLTNNHTYDADGRCICGHTISVESAYAEEDVIIDEPVESIAEEIDE